MNGHRKEAHDVMVSELKYHQKCWNKITVNHILEVLYTTTHIFN